jgi:replicative DNA helicase
MPVIVDKFKPETKTKFSDIGGERALLATIIKNGKDSFIDCSSILTQSDFALPVNRVLFSCLEKLANDENCIMFDTESIKLKANNLGLGQFFKTQKDQEYLELLNVGAFPHENIQLFSLNLKKLAIIRELGDKYTEAQSYLNSLTGDEDLAVILSKAEGYVSEFTSGVSSSDSLESLVDNIDEYIQEMTEKEPINQVGLPVGFPLWEQAIGGGPRPATIAVIVSRAKTGKSWVAINMADNMAKLNIPVLYLDSELTSTYQKDRLISLESGCPIKLWETRQFQKYPQYVQAVKDAGQRIKGIPFTYKNIGGMSCPEALLFARRWLIKSVGFNAQGQANDCCIIYDYLKLTDENHLSKFTPEYIRLGLYITGMHNFALKYNVPFITFAQSNRQGIDGNDTDIVAGSDRILWLCSSLSILKNKDTTDAELGCGWEHGNKKLYVAETRQGAGLPDEGDYINLVASLKPHVTEEQGTGKIIEGFTFSQVVQGNRAAV